MTNFPTSEPQIMTLVYRMLSGYSLHQIDFPSISTIYRIRLFNAGRSYLFARKDLVEANAMLRIATKIKNEKLSELVQVMKNCLQKSEVDVASNPEKLKLIGWGPRTEPQPVQLPSQPTDLQLITKENQTVKLKWVRPDDSQPVRNYVIERRRQTSEGLSGWTIVQISYNTEITLRNQPLGIQLEYRVRAANTAGTGPVSNTISVML